MPTNVMSDFVLNFFAFFLRYFSDISLILLMLSFLPSSFISFHTLYVFLPDSFPECEGPGCKVQHPGDIVNVVVEVVSECVVVSV